MYGLRAQIHFRGSVVVLHNVTEMRYEYRKSIVGLFSDYHSDNAHLALLHIDTILLSNEDEIKGCFQEMA